MDICIKVDPPQQEHVDSNRWAAFVECLGQSMQVEAEAEVCVSFTDDENIHHLNRQYRHIDKPTDVLAFPQDMENNLLGDVIVSLETAQRQADEKKHSLQWEMAFLVTHGFLHLLGFDHQREEDEKVMFAQQDELMEIHYAACFDASN